MKCFTKTCELPTVDLVMTHSDTIETLKVKLAIVTDHEPNEFSIVRNGKRLDDEPFRRVLEWGTDFSESHWGYELRQLGGGFLS